MRMWILPAVAALLCAAAAGCGGPKVESKVYNWDMVVEEQAQ